MIDPIRTIVAAEGSRYWAEQINADPITQLGESFTRSNGTILARLYERLTKASRRRWSQAWHDPNLGVVGKPGSTVYEKAYRQGVYDAYKALQEELS